MTKQRLKISWKQVLLDPIFLSLGFTAFGVLLAATTAVYVIEGDLNPKITSYLDSVWWGVATITTIGYGDVVPVTFVGRIIGICLMMTGPALFVLFTAALWRSVLVLVELEKEILPIERNLENELIKTKGLEAILTEINERLKQLEKKQS